jgi:hypothetical protein
MSVPHKLRAYYDKVATLSLLLLLPLLLLLAQVVTPAAGPRGSGPRPRLTGTVLEGAVAAYSTMNRFLTRFLEHALRDLDYEVEIRKLDFFLQI